MIYHLYNETIELSFDEKKHLYTVDGTKVDGVTGVLGVINKPALMYWAVNQAIEHLQETIKPGVAYDEIQILDMLSSAKAAHRKKKETAADKGSIVHNWIKAHIAGAAPEMPFNEECKNSIEQFLAWQKEHKVEFIESEKILYSKRFRYAGTTDFIAKINGSIVIGDFKTSTGIWDEYWLQIAAYWGAYLEEYPDAKIENAVIVRIGKDGVLEIAENNEFVENYTAFKGALVLHRRLNQFKDKKFSEKKV